MASPSSHDSSRSAIRTTATLPGGHPPVLDSRRRREQSADERSSARIPQNQSQAHAFRQFQYPTVPLEPLNGLQVASLLDHDEALDPLLSRVAPSGRLVIDAGP